MRSIIAALPLLAACALQPPLLSRTLGTTEPSPIAGLSYSLPKSLVTVSTKGTTTSITGTSQIPDPNARFALLAQYRAASTDDLDLSVANGLLMSVTANSTDNTPQIVDTVTSAISSTLSGDDFRTSAASDTAVFQFDYDPFAGSTQNIMGHRLTTHALDPTLNQRIANGVRDLTGCRGASLCVPLLTPIQVAVRSPSGTKVETFLTVVDPTRAMGIRLDRTACQMASNAVTFNQGIMTQYDVTKPSEVAGCLSIPLDIIRTIISAPVDAITGRTTRIENETDLLKAQVALLEEHNRLLALQTTAPQE